MTAKLHQSAIPVNAPSPIPLLPITSHQIEVALNVTRKTVTASRMRLQKRGLLTIETHRYHPMIVTLVDTANQFEEQSGEQSGTNSGTHPGNIREENTADNNRDKRIEKRERVLKKHSIECKKSERNPERSARYVAFCDWVEENAPYVAKHLKPLSETEFDHLVQRFGPQTIARNIDNLENRRDLRRRYTSLYRTLLNWCAHDPENEL